MIQITSHLRILVAVEAIDARKGIDSLAQLCRDKLNADPFSGCGFRSRRGTAIKILAYDGPGVLACDEALIEGPLQMVANGCANDTDASGASGAIAACCRQP